MLLEKTQNLSREVRRNTGAARSVSFAAVTPPPPRGRGFLGRWGAALCAVLIAAAVLTATGSPATAQQATEEAFVSNTGFSAPGQISTLTDYAQAFTTGSGAAFYRLHSVGVEFRRIGVTPVQGNSQSWVTAEIREDSGGSPGDLVGTLANPEFFDLSFRHVFTFTSAEGIRLDAGTTYFFVLDVSPPNGWTGYPRLSTANTGAEDADGLPGWSIADNRVSRGASTSDPYTGNSAPLMISLGGTQHECDETQDFRGGGWDSPSVRYVGSAADTEPYTPYAAANRCAPLVTAGGTFTLTFTADSRVSAVGTTGPVSIDSATNVQRVGRWLIGATSSPPSTVTFRAGQVSAATVAHIRLAPSGSSYRATRIPVVIVPAPGLPVVSITASDNIVQAASLTVTEGQNVSFVIVRPDGFTGAVNTRLSHSGGDVLSTAAKTILGQRKTPGGFIGAGTVDDDAWEQDGIVTAELLPGDGYRISPGQSSATVRVRDNDVSRAIVVSESSATLAEGDAVSYTVKLSGDPGGPVSVYARVSLPPASANAQRALGVCLWRCRDQRRASSGHNHQAAWTSFNSSDWNQPKTFEVYRYHDDGYPRFNAPSSWTVTHHLGSGHDNQGPSLELALAAAPERPVLDTTPVEHTPLPPVTDQWTPPRQPTPHVCTARGNIAGQVKKWHDANKSRAGYAGNWARVLAAFESFVPLPAPWNAVEPFTVAEAQAQEAHWSGWTPVRVELGRLETCRSAACQSALARQFNRDQAVRDHCPGVFD